jgi:hypothetical protein
MDDLAKYVRERRPMEDDPLLFDTNLAEEYEVGRTVLGLDDATLAFTSYGHGGDGDAVYTLSRGASAATLIHRTAKPFTLGALRCDDRVPARCFATVASPSAVVELAATNAASPPSVTLRRASDVTGLPLRGLALFLSPPAP